MFKQIEIKTKEEYTKIISFLNDNIIPTDLTKNEKKVFKNKMKKFKLVNGVLKIIKNNQTLDFIASFEKQRAIEIIKHLN